MSSPDHAIFKQSGFYQLNSLLRKFPPNPPRIEINPKTDIATLPYTGGTTGPPKGVMITHYNMVAQEIQFEAVHPFLEDGKECLVGYMPYYHAGGQSMGVVHAILRGTTQVIITTPDFDDILKAVTYHKGTFFFGVPSVYEALKDYDKTDRVNWRSLKVINCGGDTLYEETAKGWKVRTGVELQNVYGQTEVVALSHFSPLGKGKVGSIGIPKTNTMSAIVDPEEDKFLPLGEIGEIVIKGPIVTLGYWKKPENTRECEAIINGERWWRTGDLGRMDEDGYFYIYDRKRDLIKYKGGRKC
jgi:long-chain acyl-CoA synthetase